MAGALLGAGFSAPAFAAGGDETLTLYEEIAPDVVVLSASLDQGDARSLASAMRSAPHGARLRIVLVGDAGGPIRNALDASDFEVDRFVGRPLSPKALAFAVRECARDQAAEASAAAASAGAAAASAGAGAASAGAAAASAGGGAASAGGAAASAGAIAPGVGAPAASAGAPAARSARAAGDRVNGDAGPMTAGQVQAAERTGTAPMVGGQVTRVRSAPGGAPASGSSERTQPRWPTPRPLPPPPERYPIMRSGTVPGTGPAMPPGPVGPLDRRSPRGVTSAGLDRAMDEAISRFVTDAMTALDPGWLVDPGRDGKVAETIDDPTARTVGARTSGSGPTAPDDAAPVTGPVAALLAASADSRDQAPATEAMAAPLAPTASPPGVPVAAAHADATIRESDDSSGDGAVASRETRWEEPPAAPTWREPTLILRGGGQTMTRPAPPTRPTGGVSDSVDLDTTVAQADAPWEGDRRPEAGPYPRAARVGDDPPFEDDDEGMPHDLGGAADPRPVNGDDGAAPAEAAAGPRSPMARELRRKMSMMADRLFPGRGGDRSRLDVGLSHDAHAEIDLTSIGVDTSSGVGSSGPYEAIGRVDTFADTNPISRLEPTPPEAMSADDREETTGRRRSITSEPPARGDLADIDVATLIGRLLQSRFTGRVQFRRGPAEKAIQFEAGKPVFAISNLPHDRMGDLLYREGKITREQQQRARDLVVESGRRMGEILVEIGFLKPRELLPAVRHHIEDIVYSLFAWDSGEFSITAAEPTSERIRLTRHPAAIVLEGVRRKYGPEMLEARLGSAAAVVAVRSQRQLGHIVGVADLSPSERAVIQKLDGERTVQQVAEAAQVDHVVALQLAFGLVALGVAEVVEHGSSPADRLPARSRSLVGETDIAIDRQRVLAKHALANEADYFTLLGVRRDATSFEIRRAYEAARRDYAATGFPTELQRELAGELGEINRMIDEAYQVLRDERVRRSYQANLLD